MPNQSHQSNHHLTLAWLAMLAIASQALAQAPPAPAISRTPNTVLGYAVVFVLLVLVVSVSLLPSKRSHQD